MSIDILVLVLGHIVVDKIIEKKKLEKKLIIPIIPNRKNNRSHKLG